MAKSRIINVRLTPEESQMLDGLLTSQTLGQLSVSEWVRMLLHREHARRTHGKSATPGRAYRSDVRTGRPKRFVQVEPGGPWKPEN